MSAEFDFKAYLGKAKEQVEAALDGSLGPERPESCLLYTSPSPRD